MPQDFSFSIQPKLLGAILQEASLVSTPQIQLALQDQSYYPDLRLGEIVAMRGWIKQETADFFAQNWLELLQQRTRKPLGYYLQESALLEEKHIAAILKEQRITGVRFGSVAVLQGLLKSQTLDFFLMHLFPREFSKSSLGGKHQIDAQTYQQSLNTIPMRENLTQNTEHQLSQNQPAVEDIDDYDITWIG